MMFAFLALACSSPTDDSASNDTAGGPRTAPLAELSTGACPDLAASGTSTFSSSGEDRQVTVILPSAGVQPGASVRFFFHGLTEPTQTDNPGGDTAVGLDLQALSDETGDIWILPDAPVQNFYNMMSVYLWDLGLTTDHDLVLFDDLRTCVAQSYDVDLDRVVAMGFSGGALFTTVVVAHRADTLAAAIELSGGSDLEIPGQDMLWSEYSAPASGLPVLLTSGGETDVWPSTSMPIVDFTAASDTLQGELLADGHVVVRCADDRGHSMNNKDWKIAQAWADAHTFGEDSPYAGGDLGGDADWCVSATAP